LKHILVVDDDPALRAMVTNYLVDQNVRVSTASSAREMARVLTAGGVDLAILDLKLGNENGFEIVRALRAESDLPIIVLTGQHLDEIDGVVGLELGADDYLTKPFSPRELFARIRAVLRRSELQVRQPEQDAKRTHYRFGAQPAEPSSDLSFRRDRSLDQARICAFDGTFAIAATSAEPGASARCQPRARP
jgi:DNA-binding response OmpR family regulator